MQNVAYQEPQQEVPDQPEAGPEEHGAPVLSPAEHIWEALDAHSDTIP